MTIQDREITFVRGEPLNEEGLRLVDEIKTGRPRCIGCGKFLKVDRDWNQCSDCDTRDPW